MRKMQLGVIILSSLFCHTHPAWAIPGFFVPSTGDILTAYQKIRKTPAFGNCTVIPISKNHGLTALHCLSSARRFLTQPLPDQSGVIKTTKTDEITTGGAFVVLNETKLQPERWKKSSKRELLKAVMADWAIVSLENDECFEVRAAKSLRSEDELFVIGFPASAKRGVHSSDGRSKYSSQGPKVSHLGQVEFYADLLNTQFNFLTKLFEQQIKNNQLLFIDADSRPGNSGSPVVDRNGKLVGMVISRAVPVTDNRERYYKGATVAVSISSIQAQLQAQGKQTSDFFKCANRDGQPPKPKQ